MSCQQDVISFHSIEKTAINPKKIEVRNLGCSIAVHFPPLYLIIAHKLSDPCYKGLRRGTAYFGVSIAITVDHIKVEGFPQQRKNAKHMSYFEFEEIAFSL